MWRNLIYVGVHVGCNGLRSSMRYYLHDGPERVLVHDLAGVGGLHSGLHLKVFSARMGLGEVLRLGPWASESGWTTTQFADKCSDLLGSADSDSANSQASKHLKRA